MHSFNDLLNVLNNIQNQFQDNADRFWSIKSLQKDSSHLGLSEKDFLPRRLLDCKKELQEEYELLLCKLNQLVSESRAINSRFIRFSSESDVQSAIRVRSKIRYLKNAFAGDLPVIDSTLDKLNSLLPKH